MKRGIILGIFLFIFIGAIAYGSFFAYKLYSVSKKVNIGTDRDPSVSETLKSFSDSRPISLDGASDGRINILLLGMAGKGKPGQYLTDTLMVASLDLENDRIALLSLPRDLYVEIPENGIRTKINSVYQYSFNASQKDVQIASETIKETVSEITGLNMHYFVILNFDGFEKAIDDIGGINIMNERDIYDTRYPGPNYSYETFELSKGFHKLDGATALKYARQRHGDPEGDFGRAKRQQQIIQATKSKIFSAGTMFDVFALNKLLDTLGENIQTDISTSEFADFFELAKKLDTQNITNVVADAWNKDSLLKVSHVQYGSVRAFVLVPRVGNYSEIRELAENIFDLNQIKRKKEELTKENAYIAIIDRSGDPQVTSKIKNVLQENLDYKNVFVLAENSKNTFAKTIAYDMTDGQKPFTLDELAGKLPATVSYAAPDDIKKVIRDKTVDITLVIGKDLISKYNIEEGTIEDLNNYNEIQEQNLFIK